MIRFFYRKYILFLGILFLVISGCRSRSVEKSTDNSLRDSLTDDSHLFLVPEYSAPQGQWEEMPREDLTPTEKPDEISNQAETPDTNEQKMIPKVKQPSPEPMMPATAYGTNINDYKPNVTIKPQE